MGDVNTVATLKSQNLGARLEERDGVTVLVLDDGVDEVELTDEMGSKAAAVVALRRVAGTILARADMLASEGPDRNKGWT